MLARRFSGFLIIFLLAGCAGNWPPRPVAPGGAEPYNEPAPPVSEPEPAPTPQEASPASRPVPPAVLALLDEAQADESRGDLDSAVAALERALRIRPRDAVLWHRLAALRLRQNKPSMAENLAQRSNSLAGGDKALRRKNWSLIAAARLQLGDELGARQAEEKAGK